MPAVILQTLPVWGFFFFSSRSPGKSKDGCFASRWAWVTSKRSFCVLQNMILTSIQLCENTESLISYTFLNSEIHKVNCLHIFCVWGWFYDLWKSTQWSSNKLLCLLENEKLVIESLTTLELHPTYSFSILKLEWTWWYSHLRGEFGFLKLRQNNKSQNIIMFHYCT